MSRCKTEGCPKYASFGIRGEKIIACKDHSTPEMINIKADAKMCISCGKVEGRYGLEGTKPQHCVKCKTPEMIDIYNKKCICGKVRPIFGLITDKMPTCCVSCKTPEMIDICNKKCICGRVQPIFGLENDILPTCCKECKSPEMINIKDKKFCICGKTRPSFGLETDNIPTSCKECKTKEMINVVSKMCICGRAQPSFGLEDDKRPTCCKECKSLEMIYIKDKIFCICGKTRPRFGLKGENPTHCSECRTENMCNIVSKKCKSEFCDTIPNSYSKYEGYCANCYGNLYPDSPIVRNYKTKERLVVDYIRSQYEDYDWRFDKIIENGCSKRRPDIYLDLGYQIVIIEVDENQHRIYEDICENKRLMEISKDVNHRSIIFIRFNPDKYIDINNKTIPSCFIIKRTGKLEVNNNKKWNERLELLKDTVDYWLINNTTKTIELQQLFYDEI